jgi:hypothetical protein
MAMDREMDSRKPEGGSESSWWGIRRASLIVIILVMALISGNAALSSRRSLRWEAWGRFKLGRPAQGPSGLYDLHFIEKQMTAISTVLTDSQSLQELARAARVSEADFRFIEVRPIRNTSLVRVHYAGFESNGVERVASNACQIVRRYYSTNRPPVEMEAIDTSVDRGKMLGERMLDSLRSLFGF